MRLPWFAFNPEFKYAPDAGDNSGNGSGASDKDSKDQKDQSKSDSDDADEKDEQEDQEEIDQDDTKDEIELSHAKNLMQILRDPSQRVALIQRLAEQEGIGRAKSKGDAEDVVEDVESILRDAMGEDYKFIAEKLGPALKKIIENVVVNKHIKPVREGIETDRRTRETREIENAFDDVYAEFNESAKLGNEIRRLSKELQPGQGVKPKDHFRRLIRLAAQEKGITLTRKDSAKDSVTDDFANARRGKNRNSSAESLSAKQGNTNIKSGKSQHATSADEAVRMAAEAISKK